MLYARFFLIYFLFKRILALFQWGLLKFACFFLEMLNDFGKVRIKSEFQLLMMTSTLLWVSSSQQRRHFTEYLWRSPHELTPEQILVLNQESQIDRIFLEIPGTRNNAFLGNLSTFAGLCIHDVVFIFVYSFVDFFQVMVHIL